MSRYKTLLSNTLLFGIATFSSKLLSFALLPLLTSVIPEADYSTMELVTSTCNFIVPMISLCIHEAVIRFGMDKEDRKRDIFTTALLVIFAGYGILLLCWPALGLISRISAYRGIIYIYVLASALRSTATHFVRASGFSRIFALDGLFTTVTTVVSVYVLVVRLNHGIMGYIASIIIADALSALVLVLGLRLHRFFRPRGLNWETAKAMVRYAAPLVPTALFWWITNLSDRFLVDAISGAEINGIYSVSYKIPSLITMVSAIFIQAWQMAAFAPQSQRERERFYSTIFTGYCSLIFVAASGLILLVKPIISLMADERYYTAWRYVPFLVLAVSCSCLVTFLGTIYNVAKSNLMVTLTTLIGAVINVVLNLLLIPGHGAAGAAFATFASYLVVFIIRAVDTRRYMALRYQPFRIIFSLALLLLQTWVCMAELKGWVLYEIGILFLLVLCNLGTIVSVLQKFLKRG